MTNEELEAAKEVARIIAKDIGVDDLPVAIGISVDKLRLLASMRIDVALARAVIELDRQLQLTAGCLTMVDSRHDLSKP